ncbi:U-box domain-containing protein [Striga asiatica]|uniref:U-box domain-containing protein n=1 Tax=Striga asiatica TaxID=4170 RepID=A0A5A7R7X2_STRAF|nr:U-box domain-containing protein [Striga asiatica]
MAVKAVAELKKELGKLMDALVVVEEDERDHNLVIIDKAIRNLCALKEPPQEFKCPVSGTLIMDPVVLASAQLYCEKQNCFHFSGVLKIVFGFVSVVDSVELERAFGKPEHESSSSEVIFE